MGTTQHARSLRVGFAPMHLTLTASLLLHSEVVSYEQRDRSRSMPVQDTWLMTCFAGAVHKLGRMASCACLLLCLVCRYQACSGSCLRLQETLLLSPRILGSPSEYSSHQPSRQGRARRNHRRSQPACGTEQVGQKACKAEFGAGLAGNRARFGEQAGGRTGMQAGGQAGNLHHL